jgi:hypothetical protein
MILLCGHSTAASPSCSWLRHTTTNVPIESCRRLFWNLRNDCRVFKASVHVLFVVNEDELRQSRETCKEPKLLQGYLRFLNHCTAGSAGPHPIDIKRVCVLASAVLLAVACF